MKLFEMPKMDVTKFEVEDILTTSSGEPGFFEDPCIS